MSKKVACKGAKEVSCKSTKEQGAALTLTPRAPGAPFRPGESGNPAGRPKGGVSSVLRMAREAAETVALPKLIEAAQAGDREACRILCTLGIPRQKAVSLAEPLELPDFEDFTDGIRHALRLIGDGKVPVDVGLQLASIYALGLRSEDAAAGEEEREHLRALLEKRPDPPAPPPWRR